MKLLIIYIIKIYQMTIGAFLFRGHCKFSPTCSEYMIQAIIKYGAFKGIGVGMKRLSRCHPYSKSFGLDEVK